MSLVEFRAQYFKGAYDFFMWTVGEAFLLPIHPRLYLKTGDLKNWLFPSSFPGRKVFYVIYI